MSIEFVSTSEDETRRLGEVIAKCLRPRTVIALMGTLGSGKTFLTRAIAHSLGVDPLDVVSPTFTLCQTYDGQIPLVHLDAYRLKSCDEFLDLGIEEYFQSDAVTLIEWADKFPTCLPPDRLEINIEVIEQGRRFVVCACGRDDVTAPTMDCLKSKLRR